MLLKVLALLLVCLVVLLYLLFEDKLLPVGLLPQLEDQCWARECAQISQDIVEFSVNVSDLELQDLQARIQSDLQRLVHPLQDSGFQYGFNSKYLAEVAEYWSKSYDWRSEERIINSFPQFKTNIDGLNIHFLHVKPPPVRGKKIVPLLLVHGWPGSVVEFLDIIPLLTAGAGGGGDGDIMFEVIAPSIPGYGFSSAPERMGYNAMQTARSLVKLMGRLGHEKFYCQGGDWGALVTNLLSTLYPQHVRGLHLNMLPGTSSGATLKVLLAKIVPGLKSLILDEEDRGKNILPFGFLLQETGYFHLQATKPDTVGVGLSSSPLGLAAYILEKFSTWTNPAWRERLDGGLGGSHPISLDRMLSNVMVYWVTNSITSSMRYYKENMSPYDSAVANARVEVPVGFTDSPYEMYRASRIQLRGKYPDLVTFTTFPTGGHFAAMEVPRLLATDIINFVQIVETRTESKSKADL